MRICLAMKRNTTQKRAENATVADAYAIIDRAVAALGLGTVSDEMRTHPATVERWTKRTGTLSPFMARQVVRVLGPKVKS